MSRKCPPNINERSLKLLKALIEFYIRDGEPVGSKTLAKALSLPISPASIRNIMADLEGIGLLHSPHTSSGRIPTAMGYRLFVDSLLKTHPISDAELHNAECTCTVDTKLQNYTDTKELAAATSNILCNMTKLASIVMLPITNLSTLRQIEFLPLSENRVLVILVLNNHEVQNRIIYTDRNYTASELEQIGNFITANFSNEHFDKIRADLVATMQRDRQNIENLTQAIIDVANKTFLEESPKDYVISGETNLLEIAKESQLDKLRNLFEVFAKKRNILHLLDQCLKADEIKIYIGEESGYASLDDYSLVTTPYKKGGKIVGVLGVIGPTRMYYDRAIAAVDVTSKLLSAALEEIV